MKRSQVFDSLKGWAIIGIVIVHSGMPAQTELQKKLIAAAAHGVKMFFILSSLFIFLSLGKILNTDKKEKNCLINWYFTKIIRLVPLYFFFNVIFLLYNGNNPTYWIGNHTKLSVINILSNFLFLHGFNPFYINSININWYIADLVIFIIVSPLIFKKINTIPKTIISICLHSILYYLISKILLHFTYGDNYYVWEAYWSTFNVIAELPLLFIGLLIYQLAFQSNIIENVKGNKLLAASLLLFSSYILIVGFVIEENTFGISPIVICGLLFSIIVISQIIHSNHFLVNPLFSILGRYSYGIYLCHYIIIQVVSEYLEPRSKNIFYFCILLAVSFTISIISSYLIEKPFLNCVYLKLNQLTRSKNNNHDEIKS